MSQKLSKSIIENHRAAMTLLFIVVAILVLALVTPPIDTAKIHETTDKLKRQEQKQIDVQKSLFDKTKIIDEVCVKNNHIIIFSVIKAESNEPKPIEHAVVIGYCTDGEK